MIVKKNLCSRSFSRQQKILFFIVFVHFIAFELLNQLSYRDGLLVSILLIWRYILIIFLVIDVWKVTANEPTDPVLTDNIHENQVDPERLLFCVPCNHLVFKCSHHCFRCKRCAFEFDHHCKYLNVCIGGTNYIPFLMLLASFILYCILVGALTYIQQNSWLKVSLILLTVVLMGFAIALFSFHFYLNRVIGKTTFEYMIPQAFTEDQKEKPYPDSERCSN